MTAITVPLTAPISIFDGQPIRSLTVKEPNGRQYIEFGEPRVLAKNADGTMFFFEDKTAIAGYLRTCIDVEGGSSAALGLLSVKDTRAVKEALFGFFSETKASASNGSEASGASTPSTSAR